MVPEVCNESSVLVSAQEDTSEHDIKTMWTRVSTSTQQDRVHLTSSQSNTTPTPSPRNIKMPQTGCVVCVNQYDARPESKSKIYGVCYPGETQH
ncbi:hypothetical protein LSH36_1518g00032 [Paralvinella palmiformis]|uniref:Uncharacterized protein n=1 Tax=Paralvinella palmiformis TaxID=53620 RepID=A0AAD9IS75_9ANNE|nr:hypothetical protein LSH36_1518g00032 [Paralvinella palmiformis]